MLRCPEPGCVYIDEIKLITFFFALLSMFELVNNKIDDLKETLLLSLSNSLGCFSLISFY